MAGEDPKKWADVIPQHDKDLLQWASALKVTHLIPLYLIIQRVFSSVEISPLFTGTGLFLLLLNAHQICRPVIEQRNGLSDMPFL